MDTTRFDLLVRSLRPIGRRGALRLLAALGGVALGTGPAGDAVAGKDRKKSCKRGKKRCGERCIAKRKCCKNADCLPGQACSAGGACRPTSPGRLDRADPIWTPCNSPAGSYHFETRPFTWPGGPIQITMTPQDFAPAFFVFERDRFDPFSADGPCDAVRIAQSATVGRPTSIFSIEFDAGQYVLVPTSFAPGAVGTFTIVVEPGDPDG